MGCIRKHAVRRREGGGGAQRARVAAWRFGSASTVLRSAHGVLQVAERSWGRAHAHAVLLCWQEAPKACSLQEGPTNLSCRPRCHHPDRLPRPPARDGRSSLQLQQREQATSAAPHQPTRCLGMCWEPL